MFGLSYMMRLSPGTQSDTSFSMIENQYKYEVPWILDESDIKIIHKYNGVLPKKEVVQKLWTAANSSKKTPP